MRRSLAFLYLLAACAPALSPDWRDRVTAERERCLAAKDVETILAAERAMDDITDALIARQVPTKDARSGRDVTLADVEAVIDARGECADRLLEFGARL